MFILPKQCRHVILIQDVLCLFKYLDQTCNVNTTCPFSRFMTLEPNLQICKSVFNIDDNFVYKRVDFTNSYYGASGIKGTRIIFVNG